MDPDSHVLAVDFGGTFLKCAVVKPGGCASSTFTVVVSEQRWPVPWEQLQTGEAFVSWALERLQEFDDSAYSAVGLAVAGVLRADNTFFWCNHHREMVLRWPKEHKGHPLVLANDAQAAAVAEHRLGSLAGTQAGALITVGTSIGAGLVMAGTVLPSEAWAIPLTDVPGRQGTFGALCGASGVCAAGHRQGLRGLSAPEIIAAWRDGFDRSGAAARAVSEVASYFAAGVSALAEVIVAERIAVGGGIAEDLGDEFLAMVRQRLHLDGFECEIVPAHFGARAGVIGAALLAAEAVS